MKSQAINKGKLNLFESARRFMCNPHFKRKLGVEQAPKHRKNWMIRVMPARGPTPQNGSKAHTGPNLARVSPLPLALDRK